MRKGNPKTHPNSPQSTKFTSEYIISKIPGGGGSMPPDGSALRALPYFPPPPYVKILYKTLMYDAWLFDNLYT